jgi:tetratricopeptide (TPR) repeat protein
MPRSCRTVACTIPIALLILLAGLLHPAYAAPPRSAIDELDRLVKARAHESSDPGVLVKMSELYLDVGQEGDTDARQRRAAFDEGARIAKRALDLQEANADAHYLYAANLGSAAQLKGLTASALTVRELKMHVARALELQKDHAPALHMMGRMLDELPWLLGGDAQAALRYLKQAVQADPRYEHARLDLAKAYLKRNDLAAARLELQTLVGSTPASHHGAANRYQTEGRTLLVSLQERETRRP